MLVKPASVPLGLAQSLPTLFAGFSSVCSDNKTFALISLSSDKSLNTAVTVYGVFPNWLLTVTVLPIGFARPKYFCASTL
jgi:hypothetical protein